MSDDAPVPPPSLAEIEAADAELVGSVAALRAALERDARIRAKLAALVDLAAGAGERLLETAADRAPELLGRALGALLAGEIKAQLAR